MSHTTKITHTNQEEIKMRKLIVDAPELKEGQTDSSGGIRENGKISVQYKNPRPYLPTAVPQQIYTSTDRLNDYTKDFLIDVGTDLISMVWYEYGRPYIHAKLHQLGQKAISCLESTPETIQDIPQNETENSKIIDVAYKNLPKTNDFDTDDKIIRFSNIHVS